METSLHGFLAYLNQFVLSPKQSWSQRDDMEKGSKQASHVAHRGGPLQASVLPLLGALVDLAKQGVKQGGRQALLTVYDIL